MQSTNFLKIPHNLVFIALVALLFFCSSTKIYSQIAAGPMLGYSDMREVAVWLQTSKKGLIQYKYWPLDKPSDIHWSKKTNVSSKDHFMATVLLDEVEPGKKYAYELYFDKKKMSFDYALEFQSQELWQWRKDAPDFSFAVGSCTYTNEPIYDRPGKPYGASFEIFNQIHALKPDFMIWGGDNIYLREVDWNSKSGIYKRYADFKRQKELQPLFARTHNYAIWDDHDFGPNDSDRSYWGRSWTREAFKANWANPNYIFPDEAITGTFFWQDVQFFLLDDRSFKAPEGDTDPARDYFGEKQLQWLIDALTASNASFKIIVSGGQIVNPYAAFENMATYPKERNLLFDKIAERGISGVVFITGDRHHTSLRKWDRIGNYPLYDLTVSPLTSGIAKAHEVEKNAPDMIPGTLVETIQTFGLIQLSGSTSDRQLKINVYDSKGEFKWDYTITAKELADTRKR